MTRHPWRWSLFKHFFQFHKKDDWTMQCCASTSALWTTNRSFSTRKVKASVSFWHPDLFLKMNNSSDIFEFFNLAIKTSKFIYNPRWSILPSFCVNYLFEIFVIYHWKFEKGDFKTMKQVFQVLYIGFMVIFRPFLRLLGHALYRP